MNETSTPNAANTPLSQVWPAGCSIDSTGALTFHGRSAQSLLDEFGSPLYVMDTDDIDTRARHFLHAAATAFSNSTTHVSFAAGLARSNDQDVPVQASVHPSAVVSVAAPDTARPAASSAWMRPACTAVTVPFVRPSVPLKTFFGIASGIPPWSSESFSMRRAV